MHLFNNGQQANNMAKNNALAFNECISNVKVNSHLKEKNIFITIRKIDFSFSFV